MINNTFLSFYQIFYLIISNFFVCAVWNTSFIKLKFLITKQNLGGRQNIKKLKTYLHSSITKHILKEPYE